MAEKTFVELLEDATDKSRELDAPLGVRLKAVADEVGRLSPQFAAIVDRMVARLAASRVGENAPRPGETMPDFMLPDESGNLVRLQDLLQKGPVVLSFNRGHWCPYCKINVDGLAKISPQVEEMGAQIVAISPEKTRFGAELKAYAKAPFPVLADIGNGYALELNLLFWVGDEKSAAMKGGGYDIVPYQGNESWMLPVPATFIVGQDGKVKARHIDVDYRHRMDLEDLLDALSAAREGAPRQTA